MGCVSTVPRAYISNVFIAAQCPKPTVSKGALHLSQQMRSEHDKFVARSMEVDSVVRDIIPRLKPYLNYFYRLVESDLQKLFDKLIHHRAHLRPPKYREYMPNLYG